MASPRHIPAAVGPGNKENISENGPVLLDRPVLHKEVAFSAKGKKKPAGFNLRKSIAWNPAFFTEEGVLDNSELSVLTGSELMANRSPSSSVNGIMPPLCRPGRYDSTYVLKEDAGNSRGKSSSNYRCIENKGRRLFSSAKTPKKDERKDPVVTQNRSSVRSFQKDIPRIPVGSPQKKIANSTSTAHISRIPKKPLSSLPMAPRSTTTMTTVSKSNKKLAPVKTEHIHRVPVPGLLSKSKIVSGSSLATDVVPAVAAINDENNSSVKSKDPQISISKFAGTRSAFAKPSALRMPSPSIGFFTQENANMSHGNAAGRNVGRFSAVNTSSVVKPPRYKQPEDLKSGLHLSKLLSTNCTTATNSLPVTTDRNTNTLVSSEKRPLSKIISTYSAKSRDAIFQERPEVYCLLAGSGVTRQPLSSNTNDGARNSVPIVYKDTSNVEGRVTIKEIGPVENSLSPKATCFSTIEAIEDFCSLKATCSSTKPAVGSELSLSCISSQSNDLSCQSKTDNGSMAAADLELPVSLSEGDLCTVDIDSFRNSGSCDHHNTERATLMESMEYALCSDRPPSGSSSDRKSALADRKSILNGSLYDEGESSLSEEPNSDGVTESVAATDLELSVSLLEGQSCIDSFQKSDSCDHQSTEHATSSEPMEYTGCADQMPPSSSSCDWKPVLADRDSVSSDSLYDEGKSALSEEPNTDGATEHETDKASAVIEDPVLHMDCEHDHSLKRTKCSPMKPEAPMTSVERRNVLSVEQNMKDKKVFGSNKLLAQEGPSDIEKDKAVDRSRTNTILRDHLKNLVPFTEEWLAVMEACGQEVLEQKSGAVQNSPPDKAAPEPSPWSPVKRKAQDVGPFDCTKYSKSVRTSGTP